MNLKPLQREWAFLLRNRTRKIPPAMFAQSPGLPVPQRLEIYRHAYHARLAGVLEIDFPHTLDFLKAKRFQKLAGDYEKKYPSKKPSVDEYGERFPAFVKKIYGAKAGALAYLDWCETQCLFSPEPEALTPSILKKLAAGQSQGLLLSRNLFLFETQNYKNRNIEIMYRFSSDDFKTISIKKTEWLALRKLDTPVALDDLAEKLKLKADHLQETLSRWVQLKLIKLHYNDRN